MQENPEATDLASQGLVPMRGGADTPGLPVVSPPPPPPEPAPPAPRPSWRRAGLALALGLVAAGGAGFYLAPWGAPPVTVATEVATLAPVTRVLAVNGRIAAQNSVEVRALVGGRVLDVPVAEGDRVARGAVLARIDAATQQAMLRQAVAGMDAALVAEAQARDTLARAEALGSTVARAVRDAAARALQSAQQEVARTTALVDQARVLLAQFTVTAPLGGHVLGLDVVPGQSIDPTTRLMTVADLDRLKVETDVDEAYASQIRADLPAVMQLAGEGALRNGRIARVSRQVDPATGGLAIDLVFDAPVQAPIGLTVTINIIVERRDAALSVPRTAFLTGEPGEAVLVVEEGTARRRAVTVIEWPAARLLVTRGLAPGDVVILDASGVSDGQAVRVVR